MFLRPAFAAKPVLDTFWRSQMNRCVENTSPLYAKNLTSTPGKDSAAESEKEKHPEGKPVEEKRTEVEDVDTSGGERKTLDMSM